MRDNLFLYKNVSTRSQLYLASFLFSQIFTIVRKINYNEERFTFLEKEGNCMERMFRVLGFWTGIFSVNRAYVYIRIWGIFNCFLHWIYILYNILTCPWSWALKGWQLPSFFIFSNHLVDL